jgi:hypothetical protein
VTDPKDAYQKPIPDGEVPPNAVEPPDEDGDDGADDPAETNEEGATD